MMGDHYIVLENFFLWIREYIRFPIRIDQIANKVKAFTKDQKNFSFLRYQRIFSFLRIREYIRFPI
jgi:hypothetical protein